MSEQGADWLSYGADSAGGSEAAPALGGSSPTTFAGGAGEFGGSYADSWDRAIAATDMWSLQT